MPVTRGEAHRALQLLAEYRGQLHDGIQQPEQLKGCDPGQDTEAQLLINAIDHVVEVFQFRLYRALIDLQDLYECTLLDQSKPLQEKIRETQAVAAAWEKGSAPDSQQVPADCGSPPPPHNDSNNNEPNKDSMSDRFQEPRKPRRSKSHKRAAEESATSSQQQQQQQLVSISQLPITTEVVLHRGPTGFGFSIAGGSLEGSRRVGQSLPIYVTRLTPHSGAARRGELHVNDRILSVNGISLVGVTHEHAVEILQSAGTRLKLVVERDPPLLPLPNTLAEAPDAAAAAESSAEPQPTTDTDVSMRHSRPQRSVSQRGKEEEEEEEEPEELEATTPSLEETRSRRSASRQEAPRPSPAPAVGPMLFNVTLHKHAGRDLGFSIAGGLNSEHIPGDSGIFITKVSAGSLAAQDGRISQGDRLIQVNDQPLINVEHERAVRALKRAGDELRLVLIKKPGAPPAAAPTGPPAVQGAQARAKRTPLEGSAFSMPNVRVHEGAHRAPRAAPPADPALPGPTPDMLTGLVDYTAARTMSSLLERWPNARMVTLYKSGWPDGSRPTSAAASTTPTSARSGSLGFNIVGVDGVPGIYISQVQPGKPAAVSRQVFVGDHVLAVNGLDVTASNLDGATRALKQAEDRVDLVLVHAPEEYFEFESRFGRSSQPDVVRVARSGSQPQQPNPGCLSAGSSMRGLNLTSHSAAQSVVQTGRGGGGFEVFYVRAQVDYEPRRDRSLREAELERLEARGRSVASFRSGDVFRVKGCRDADWWLARAVDLSRGRVVKTGRSLLLPTRQHLHRMRQLDSLIGRRSRAPSSSSSRLTWSGSGGSRDSSAASSGDGRRSQRRQQHRRRRRGQRGSTSATRLSLKAARHNRCVGSLSSLGHSKAEADQAAASLDYTEVTPIQVDYTRPVVILGTMKDNIGDDLLSEFPDKFGVCVPYTTRSRRPGEQEGRDYHFVLSRSIMEQDIREHKYIEAGEYNGNLYGTHVQSVFDVADKGLHCLLDVGGPALKRLDAAGLNPIAVLVADLNGERSSAASPSSGASSRSRQKVSRIVRDYASCLTAIVSEANYEDALTRVKEVIWQNSGSRIWIESTSNF